MDTIGDDLKQAYEHGYEVGFNDGANIVRCKDCRFSKPIPEHAAKAFNAELVRDCTYQRGDWKQVYGFSVVSVDGYCDEGERRMDAVALSETETTTEEEKDE